MIISYGIFKSQGHTGRFEVLRKHVINHTRQVGFTMGGFVI